MQTKVRARFSDSHEPWRHLRRLEEHGQLCVLQITPCKKPGKCKRCQAKLAHVRERLSSTRFPGEIIRRRLKDRTNHFLVMRPEGRFLIKGGGAKDYLSKYFGIAVSVPK